MPLHEDDDAAIVDHAGEARPTGTGASRVADRAHRAHGDDDVIRVTDLDLGDDIVFVTDRDGVIVDVNDAFVRKTGFDREEAIGSTPRLLSSGLHDDSLYDQLWQTITAGGVWEGELVDRRRDGTLRTHRVTITPVRDGSGHISHFVAVERDVSSELARQAAGGPVGIAHTDATGFCIYADRQVARLLEQEVSELLGDGLAAGLQPEDARAMQEVIVQATDTGREHHVDVESRRGRWISVEAAPLTVASGGVIGARLALEDVTRHMAAHEELTRRDALLGSVLDALDEPVAVVGPQGTVVTANAAWRDRARQAAADPLLVDRVGTDLVGRLREHGEEGDPRAARLATLLSEVVRGHRPAAVDPELGVHITPLAWDQGGAVVRLSDRPED